MVRWLPRFRQKPRQAAAAPKPAPPPAAPAVAAPAPGGGFHIESYSKTHEGCVRTHNEDSYVARDDGGLWAVADGMGGHEGGEWASGRIVRELGRIDLALGYEDVCEEAAQAVSAANKQILAEGKERGKSMGSTLVMLVIEGARYSVLWAGDSRAYLMRGGRLERLSRDHTQVQEMVTRGLMTAEQAQGHPMGHVLSRAVGVQKEVEIDRVEGEVQPGDIFLLCSDGLHGVVGEETIGDRFARAAPDRALDELIELTLEKGAPDNVTGIAFWVSEPTLISFAGQKS
jgi:serine/threonine protein phosphatase PrpC